MPWTQVYSIYNMFPSPLMSPNSFNVFAVDTGGSNTPSEKAPGALMGTVTPIPPWLL